MSQGIEPMTAAEWEDVWRRSVMAMPAGLRPRILAALEEREALLGERDRLAEQVENFRELARIRLKRVEQLDADVAQLKVEVADWKELYGQASSRAEFQKSDASVGALVRRVLDHPAATRGHSAFVYTHNGTWTTAWTEKGLQLTLSHLDSLLPKEPEWSEPAPSKYRYRVQSDGKLWAIHTHADAWRVGKVRACDVAFVAKLMEARDGAGW